jgi:hypothetical protein
MQRRRKRQIYADLPDDEAFVPPRKPTPGLRRCLEKEWRHQGPVHLCLDIGLYVLARLVRRVSSWSANWFASFLHQPTIKPKDAAARCVEVLPGSGE